MDIDSIKDNIKHMKEIIKELYVVFLREEPPLTGQKVSDFKPPQNHVTIAPMPPSTTFPFRDLFRKNGPP